MCDNKKHEPKKIKMPPLVDRSNEYDTLSFDNETLPETSGSEWNIKTFWKTYTVENEDYKQDDTTSL